MSELLQEEIKEVIILGTTFIAKVKESINGYTIIDPVIPNVVATEKGIALQFLPPSLVTGSQNWNVPKEHVYAINSMPLHIIDQYKKFIEQMKAAELGLELPTKNKKTPNLKKLN